MAVIRGIDSALLVINRPSGHGLSVEAIEQVQRAFHDCFRAIPCRSVQVTDNHAQVRRRTQDFLAVAHGSAFLLGGGGSGTTRALVQGLMDAAHLGTTCLDGIQVSSLRLGSGNLVPKYFGMPRDLLTSMRGIANDLSAGRSQRCCVYRCTFVHARRAAERIYGLTMGGLGQFGCVPGDIKRWRRRHPWLMRWMSQLAALETINTAQYVAFSLVRAAHCIARPDQVELIEVQHAGRVDRLRLLAGVLLNFDFPDMPIRAGCHISEPRLVLCLLPYVGRWQTIQALLSGPGLSDQVCRYEISAGQPVELLCAEQNTTTLALDEDTFAAPAQVTFEVAGTLRFVSGVPARQSVPKGKHL